jgi:3-mercaptopyruvate sulfurtransferase SseA
MNDIEIDWNEKAKRLLKSELVRRGISTEDLVSLLENIGVEETKASVDSKISRGTFSAAFLIQCLNAMGIRNFIPEVETEFFLQEPKVVYQTKNNKTKIK